MPTPTLSLSLLQIDPFGVNIRVLFLLFLLINQSFGSLCKGDDGIAITLHKNEYEESQHAIFVQEDVRASNLDKGYEKLARMVEATKDRTQALKIEVNRGNGKMTKGKESVRSFITLADSGLFNQILLGNSSIGFVTDQGHV